MNIPIKILLGLFVSVVFSACGDQNIHLPGGYVLERYSENGKYYVLGPDGKDDDIAGAFDGIVSEIAWDDRTILANVRKSYRGDSDGYYWIDIKTRNLSGPISEKAIHSDARLRNLTLKSCDKVLRGQ